MPFFIHLKLLHRCLTILLFISGDITYHISQPTVLEGLFDITNDGSIVMTEALDQYSEGSTLNLTVYAVDSGGKENSSLVYIILPGTTVMNVAVEDTIKYFTFFSYAPNMAWFVPLMMLLLGTTLIVIHTIATADCSSCMKSKP